MNRNVKIVLIAVGTVLVIGGVIVTVRKRNQRALSRLKQAEKDLENNAYTSTKTAPKEEVIMSKAEAKKAKDALAALHIDSEWAELLRKPEGETPDEFKIRMDKIVAFADEKKNLAA